MSSNLNREQYPSVAPLIPHHELINASRKQFLEYLKERDEDMVVTKKLSEIANSLKAAKEEEISKLYTNGIALPNSAALPDILPKGYFKAVIDDKFFKTLNYRGQGPTHTTRPESAAAIARRMRARERRDSGELLDDLVPEEDELIVKVPSTPQLTIKQQTVEREVIIPKPQEVVIVNIPLAEIAVSLLFADDDEDNTPDDGTDGTPVPKVVRKRAKGPSTKRSKSRSRRRGAIGAIDVAADVLPVTENSLISTRRGDEATKKLVEIHGMKEDVVEVSVQAKSLSDLLAPSLLAGIEMKTPPVKKKLREPKPEKAAPIIADETPVVIVKPKARRLSMIPKSAYDFKASLSPEPSMLPNMPTPKLIFTRKSSSSSFFAPNIEHRRIQSTPQRGFSHSMHQGDSKAQLTAKMGEASSASAKPITDLCRTYHMELDEKTTIGHIVYFLGDLFKSRNSNKIVDAAKATAAIFQLFKDDIVEEKKFETFVEPMLDAYLSDSKVTKIEILSALVEMGIRHDNVLSLLIIALNERDKAIVALAIKGLSHYGIADKEGLKRAMIELGVIKGKVFSSSYYALEAIAAKRKFEQEIKVIELHTQTEAWVAKDIETFVDAPRGNMNRVNSYFEHLAGPYFPPDSHDFEAKERAKALLEESVMSYDMYWKHRYLKRDISSPEVLWADVSPQLSVKIESKRGTEEVKWRTITREKPRSVTPKRKSSAHISLAVTRIMSRGVSEMVSSIGPRVRPSTSRTVTLGERSASAAPKNSVRPSTGR